MIGNPRERGQSTPEGAVPRGVIRNNGRAEPLSADTQGIFERKPITAPSPERAAASDRPHIVRSAREHDIHLAQESEKASMIGTVRARLTDMPQHLSFEDYLALCEEIGRPTESSFSSPQVHDVFRNLAPVALPRIYPDIQPVHLALDMDSQALRLVGTQDLTHLPEQIHGVPTEEVLSIISKGIRVPTEPEKRKDRIAIARGMCTDTSMDGLRQLLTEHEVFDSFAYTRRIEPACRIATPKDEFYPRIQIAALGYGHSLITLPYAAEEGPMELLVDPTIAQVDSTQSYDIEVSAVPQSQVQNFLLLRYGTVPYATVRDKSQSWK